jgi:hypothetical protein
LFPMLPESMVEEKIKEYGESLSRPEPSIYPYRREIESSIIEPKRPTARTLG